MGGCAIMCSLGTLTLTVLTAGHQYRVQFWVWDSRYLGDFTESVSSSGTDINGPTLTTRVSYTGGTYVIGSFTANTDTKIFKIVDTTQVPTGFIILNAFQPRDVTLAVVNTSPTSLAASVSGNVLGLSWPADHIGWRLLVQTNNFAAGISSNPSDLGDSARSAGINQTNITINTTNPTEYTGWFIREKKSISFY